LLVPFALWPNLYLVIGKRGVAVLAGIVKTTTLHLDRNNVSRSVIVFASGFQIDIYTTDVGTIWKHFAT
jgi:hypothetical protein